MGAATTEPPSRGAAGARRAWAVALAATAVVLSGVSALALMKLGVDPASLFDIVRARYAFAATGLTLVVAAAIMVPRSMPTWEWGTAVAIVSVCLVVSFTAALNNTRGHVLASARDSVEHAATTATNPATPSGPGRSTPESRIRPIGTEMIYTLGNGGIYFVVDRSRGSLSPISMTRGWLYLPTGTAPEFHDIAAGWTTDAIAPSWWWITTWN